VVELLNGGGEEVFGLLGAEALPGEFLLAADESTADGEKDETTPRAIFSIS